MRGAARGVVLAAMVLFVSSGGAAQPAGRLVYQRGAGAESCPDEAALRGAVASRVGADPFEDATRPTYSVTIGLEGERLVGRVVLVDASGLTKGVRELSAEGDCAELVDGLSLALSLAINPDLATDDGAVPGVPPVAASAEPPPAAIPAGVATPEQTLPVLPAPAIPERPRVSVGIGAVGYGSVGTAPALAFGALEDFYLQPIKSVRLVINGASEQGICGTFTWGDGPAPAAPTDPSLIHRSTLGRRIGMAR